MPNHCLNELVFRGVDHTAQDRILAAACEADGKINFQILVPIPLNVWRGNVGEVHRKAFKTRIGLDWQVENWGTKWNAYDNAPIERTDDSLTLRFQTAWCPPYPWLAALLNHTALAFDHNWLDEGGGAAMAGRFYNDPARWGNNWDEVQASPDEHLRLHRLFWGSEEFEDEDDSAATADSDEAP